ncbi:MAG: dhaL [Acidimicrobiaceae bacterium]|nr:dhaL [Acidimicrobiaceae bacterium]
MTATLGDVAFVIGSMARTAVDNEGLFGELDAVVGDGDFGYSMARGFEAVLAGWSELDRASIGGFLKGVATTVMGRMGGTSGPIWGTALLRAGTVAGNESELECAEVLAMLWAAIEGIRQRGKSDVGDKTLLDALVPAVNALEGELLNGGAAADALSRAAVVASEAAEATRPMVAKRGRASYAGDRSVGTLDPGAAAVARMFQDIAASWSEHVGRSDSEAHT